MWTDSHKTLVFISWDQSETENDFSASLNVYVLWKESTHRFRLQIHLPSSSKSLAVFTCADTDTTSANIHTNLWGQSVTFICLYNLRQDFHTKLLKLEGLCAVKKNNSVIVLKYKQTASNAMFKNTVTDVLCICFFFFK